MKFGSHYRYLITSVIALFMVLALCLPGIPVTATVGTTAVSVSGPALPVSPGSQFTVSVNIAPGSAIAGAQFNLAFTPVQGSVVSVTEGNLLKQNGASTYFTPGLTNNATGTITGAASAITTPGQTVSSTGTMVTITMLAGNTRGTYPLTLSNVVVGDINGQSVPVSVTGGQFSIDRAPVLSPIGNKNVNVTSALTFVNSASDPDGDSLTYSAANLPAGASFTPATRTFSWTPSLGQVGSFTNVRFDVNDGLMTTSETITITVNKLTPVFSNLSSPGINYGVTPTSLSGTLKSGALIPTGSISITLNTVTQTAAIDGSGNFSSSFATGGLTTAGSPYSISYVYAGDANYNNTADTSKTLTVNSAAATVTLGSLSQTYDGSAKSATATTSPTGLTVSFTYNGLGAAPAAPGSYTVVATVTSAGYSGSASGTLVIAKATPVFSNLSSPSINYGTTPTSLSGNLKSGALVPSGSVWITLNGVSQAAAIDGSGNFSYFFATGSLLASGSPYAISYVYSGDANFNNAFDTSKTLTVSNIAAAVTLGSLSQTYSGTARTATAATSPSGLSVSFTYNGSGTAPTNAGSYTVVAVVTTTGYSGNATGTMVVARVTPVFSSLSAPGINFGATPTSLSGNLKSGALIPTGSISITLNGVTQTAPLDGSGNFSSSFATGSLATSGSPYTISYVYAGDTNFNGVSDTSRTLTVSNITATVTLGSLSQTYDGSAKSATATTIPGGLTLSFTYNGSGVAPAAAGNYTVVAAVTSPGYGGSASGTLVIAKVTPAFSSLSAPSISYGTTPASLSGNLKSGALIPTGSISITLNGVTQTAAIDGSGNFSSSFTTGSLTPGGYTISYAYTGDTNFNSASDISRTLTVSSIAATVTLGSLSQTYDGTAKNATATTSPTGLTVSFTYNGSGSAPAHAGSYTVVAAVTTTGYSGSATGTMVIAKVTPVFSSLSAPSINFGVTPTSLSGALKSGALIPAGNVSITLNGVTQMAAIDGSGNFSSSFATGSLTAAGSPYTITYVYAASTNFNAASDISKTLTVVQPFAAWDVNMDRAVNVLDMISVSQHIGESGAPGWIKQDVNGDGVVSVLDLIITGQNWTG